MRRRTRILRRRQSAASTRPRSNLKDHILSFENRVLSMERIESFCYSTVKRLLEEGVLRGKKAIVDIIARDHQ
jgi:hypothetical protein